MNASIRLKDVYPFALFLTLISLWGIIGVSDKPQITASAIQLSQVKKPPDARSTCENGSDASSYGISCTVQKEKLFSWLSETRQPSRLLSKLERARKFQ